MSDNEKPRHHGRVVCLLPIKGFGFISAPDIGHKRLFFRRADISGDVEPVVGDDVTFELITDRRDRSRAVAITLENHAT
jgi:cold shock CspA family protein